MEVANRSENNILWIDVAKFLAMFLVILEHVILAFNFQNTDYIAYIRNVVISFHMPLFFFVSGYLYKQKSKSDNYSKILWGLLIPYLIYQFLYLPLKLGFYIFYEHIPSLVAAIKCFIGIILGDNLGITGSNFSLSVCPACWFIMVMMQLRLIFAQININRKNLFLLCFFSILIQILLKLYNIDLYFCIDNTLYAIPYFCVGVYLKNYSDGLKIITKRKKVLLILTFFILLQISYFYKSVFHNLLSMYLCGFVGTFFLIFLSQLSQKTSNFVTIIGKNTLFLIFFQSVLLFITKWIKISVLFSAISQTSNLLIISIFFSCAIYVISYFVILFLYRYDLRIILGKFKKEKK